MRVHCRQRFCQVCNVSLNSATHKIETSFFNFVHGRQRSSQYNGLLPVKMCFLSQISSKGLNQLRHCVQKAVKCCEVTCTEADRRVQWCCDTLTRLTRKETMPNLNLRHE